jgi:hypothetical protein
MAQRGINLVVLEQNYVVDAAKLSTFASATKLVYGL